MDINQGDVVWVDLDDGATPASHLHVVAQNNVFNRSRVGTVLVCALSSNLKLAAAPGNVLIEAGEAGLAKPYVAVVPRLFAVFRGQITKRVGALSKQRMAEILAGVRLLTEARDVD